MQDFRDYAKNAGNNGGSAGNGGGKSGGKNSGGNGGIGGGNLFETVSRLSREFDGKSRNDLLRAIYKEAERGKRAGTLTNAEIDGFVAMLSPALDEKKRGYLIKIAQELKKI